ncbi:hypothetical protein AVEN_92522-1 [Araneus ventricosus]|uniref:Uncharacterized protein n=1 Tax=Araneus ventricosus TaxID=182803 RepID=A0A4Y2AJA1_ARAVE|nr:hypothetical protein AVEN_92522-1 [Araneus ventricosus]
MHIILGNLHLWWEHQFYQSCLRADGSAQTGQLASAVVEVMVRDMRSHPSPSTTCLPVQQFGGWKKKNLVAMRERGA